MTISRTDSFAVRLLELMGSQDGWSTRSIDDIHIRHVSGLSVNVDSCDYMGEIDARVSVHTPDGHLEFLTLRKGWFIFTTPDQTDPYLVRYKAILERCRAVHLTILHKRVS